MRVLVLLRQTLRRGGEGGQLSQQLLKQAPPQGTLQQRLAHGTAASAPAAAAASGAPTAAQQLGIARMQALVGASGQVSQRASGACSSSSAASGWASRVAPHHCTHWPSASAACSFGSRAKGRASALELSSAAPGACSTSASSRQALTDVQPVLLSRAGAMGGTLLRSSTSRAARHHRSPLLAQLHASQQGPRGAALQTRAVGGEAATAEAKTSATSKSSSSSKGDSAGQGVNSQLVFVTGAYVLPHPEKMAKGGEDWFFIADSMRAMGVADGVGGWAEVGVDAGAYARQLMGHAKDHADKVTATGSAEYKNLCSSLNAAGSTSGQVDVTADSQAVQLQQTILEKAYYKTEVRGSSTACVLVVAGDRVLASNLGDSGFLLLRDGQVVFHSPQQQHDFNFPYQIGSVDSMSDPPQAAQRFELVVQPGDVLVIGTDGLWDNCFDEEILSVIRYCQDVNMAMDKTAQVLAHYARHRASDPKFASPFAYAAFQAGFAYMGGKMDDITVVVARVALASEVADNPIPGQGGNNHALPGSASSKL